MHSHLSAQLLAFNMLCLVLFSLHYKGLQPGMAAQPIGPNK
jgi:hypothetical protein